MKLNAILKEEAKSQITEVKRPTFYSGKRTGTETDLYIGKTRVIIRQGVVQAEIPAEGPISEEIKNFIVGVRAESTLHEELLGITRAKGKYVLPNDKETTGNVEFSAGIVCITCYGPTREKTVELYELIRSGNIRPADEWDKPQVTGGPDQLKKVEDELKETKARLDGAMAHITGLEADIDLSRKTFEERERAFVNACKKNVRLRQLARNINNESLLLWVSRSTVAAQIDAILDDNTK